MAETETIVETEVTTPRRGRPPGPKSEAPKAGKVRFGLYHRPGAPVPPVKVVIASKNEDGTYHLNFEEDGKDSGKIFVKFCPATPVIGGGHVTLGSELPDAPDAAHQLADESVPGSPIETKIAL